ncbi:MAG: tetratricopeptide repeat protein [Firmicutes bacterium]|nr:tetratricopeptide repeat protein [Bacillota bacterium]MCM1400844.1 tetratricopeptide repeat protein [Bacteroides sp.]MCM1476665.1 tetratricopeptide repeat protein [Bacteroides sp.]
MKLNILFTFILIALGLQEATASADSLSLQADSAYLRGEYDKAAALYQQQIATNGTSAALYYNLGNSHYRMGKPAKAVIDYERALRIDPSMKEARSNLEFVNSKLIDKKGYEGSFMSRTFNDITSLLSSNAWAWLAFTLFALTIIGAALYLFSSGIVIRKAGFFGGGLTLFCCIVSIVMAVNAYKIATTRSVAVVISSSSILSTSPRAPQNRSEEAMLLHEGARVNILDSISSPTDSLKTVWYDVSFDNEHRAWINSADVEII